MNSENNLTVNNKANHKILVLYTELADYILNSFENYTDNIDAEFYVFHWPINSEAPFIINNSNKIKLYNKVDFNNVELLEIANNINPDAIVCAGWMDKDYVNITKQFTNKIPTILTMDNHWDGSLKQHIWRFISKYKLINVFSNIWVPGKPQEKYAIKLGFRKQQILKGFYVANNKNFKDVNYKVEHKFVYVGRYINHKGIKDLWQAFTKIKEEKPNNWKLECFGTGELWDKKTVHEDIIHNGFVQPTDFRKKISGGVFVLPSHFEPWGVVVHEFALSGFPMIISDKVGAATEFTNSKNGIIFESNNVTSLINAMKTMINYSDEKLMNLSKNSVDLSDRITNEKWADQLYTTIVNFKR